MAELTATKTTYGFKCTGGITATTVAEKPIWVYKFEYIPATAANKVTITDIAGNSITKIAGAVVNDSVERIYGDRHNPAKFDGLIVTLTGANDELHIYL